MGTGKDDFRARALPPDQCIPEEGFSAFCGVMLQADVDGQTLWKQYMRSDAVHIPGIPPLCEPVLHRFVARGFRFDASCVT
jgi:hypothetical protein